MRDVSLVTLRDAVLARFSNASVYESLVTRMSFTDRRFSILPVSCVVKDVLKAHPGIKGGLADPQFERGVFLVLRSLLCFRKELQDVDVPLEKLRNMTSLFEVDLRSPFSGFILEKNPDGKFIRFKTPCSDSLERNDRKRKHSTQVRPLEMSCFAWFVMLIDVLYRGE